MHAVHTSIILFTIFHSNYLFTVCLHPYFPSPKYAHTRNKSTYPWAVTQPLTNAEMRILEKE